MKRTPSKPAQCQHGKAFGKFSETILQTCQMISANLGEKKIMGGFGSGRGQGGKDTTSDMHRWIFGGCNAMAC
jgi:hypothetical protein